MHSPSEMNIKQDLLLLQQLMEQQQQQQKQKQQQHLLEQQQQRLRAYIHETKAGTQPVRKKY